MTTPLVSSMWATWIDPTGVEWPLSDTHDERGWFTTREIGGWGSVPLEYTLDPVPRGGQDVRYIRTTETRVTWPLHVYGDSHPEFLDRWRSIKRAITMTAYRAEPGILRIARSDGSAREIDAYYEDGFKGEPGENWLSANPVITFMCPDGFWRDTEAVTVAREYVGTPQSFLDDFFTLSPSQVLGATVVNNPGDIEAWPTWTITGPMLSLTATNLTTGRAFTLTHTLTAGQQITVTTFRPTVRGPAGENLVNALDWPSAYLWGLVPGDNSVSFVAGGSNTGTKVELDFYPRYDGA